MEKIYHNLTELVGHTPLLELHRLSQAEGIEARLLAKLESFNPGGSVKDRVALRMIEAAEQDGSLHPGGFIIEPTSGNTGIGLAWAATVKGYRLLLTMPETMSRERQNLLRALGAELILTPGSEGMDGAIRRAAQLKEEHPGSVILQQFENPANPEAHRLTTAQEIWTDTDGNVDILVASVGTGGTLCGTAEGLKLHNPNLLAVAVEPDASPVLSGGRPGTHAIQGIGAGFVPANYHAQTVDRIERITDKEAFAGARLLASTEGLLAGISSGAALQAALRLAREPQYRNSTIVVILPDTGERYLSTPLFSRDN